MAIMKKFILSTLALVITLSCNAQASKHRPLHWSATDKYRLVDTVNQIIAVQYTGESKAIIKLFEKERINGKVVWNETLSCDGFVGQNGIGKVREGDKLTPIGDFGMIEAFGIKPNPGTSLPWIDVVETTYCCADSKAYNRIIDVRDLPHNCRGEHMIEYTPEYNYGFFFDYNKECVQGKGSAIFFHCTGPKPSTAGCVAVSEKDMVTILRAITPTARVVIDHNYYY